MTLIRLYLIGYFAILLGATLVLWRTGVLARIPALWVATALGAAIGLGILLALLSRPTVKAGRPRELD